MSEQARLTEAERLAEQLDRWERGLDGANETDAWQNRLARAILASDWLAAREKPLRDALAQVEARSAHWFKKHEEAWEEVCRLSAQLDRVEALADEWACLGCRSEDGHDKIDVRCLSCLSVDLLAALASTPAAEDADGGEGR